MLAKVGFLAWFRGWVQVPNLVALGGGKPITRPTLTCLGVGKRNFGLDLSFPRVNWIK
jgi:hypothetical protein